MKVAYLFSKVIGILRGKWMLIRHMGRLKLGTRVVFGKCSFTTVKEHGVIKISDGCCIGRNSRIASVGGDLSVGHHTYFNQNADVVCRKSIKIGDNCAIGPGVTIYDHDHKFGKNGIESGYKTSAVVVGDHCWIGANVIILRGTNIGNNCVIGAGCVVKGDVPDNTLVTQSREMILRPLE